jgi:hypothetical protein
VLLGSGWDGASGVVDVVVDIAPGQRPIYGRASPGQKQKQKQNKTINKNCNKFAHEFVWPNGPIKFKDQQTRVTKSREEFPTTRVSL